MRFTRSLVGAAFLALALSPTAVLAHGETATTDPEAGAKLKAPPGSVSVSLTEPPAVGAQFTVEDGCGEVVSTQPQVDGDTLSVAVGEAQPGRWTASYKVVSSVDGHVTKDSFDFSVAGSKDCSNEDPKKGDGKNKGDGNGGGPGSATDDDKEGSSFPVIPVAAGTLVLVGIAVAIRLRSGS